MTPPPHRLPTKSAGIRGVARLVICCLSLIAMVSSRVEYSVAADAVTISGYVRDATSNEELIGAGVHATEADAGVTSNAYGFYSLTLPPGSHTLRYATMGYEPRDTVIALIGDIRLDVALDLRTVVMDSIVVTAERTNENTQQVGMGSLSLTPAQARSIPVLFGEQDVLKTIQLLPGIREAGEGNTGFHVRGGGVDQNLVLLDEAIVYNPSHLLGFFSVFNSDAVKDLKLVKGSGSAEYGGRLASVLDVKMKEGNSNKFHGLAGIGLIASRLLVEGPIAKGRSSYMVAARRTYFDLFLKGSSDAATRKTRLYFYDLNAKSNYHIGPNDRLFLSGYFGRDVLGYKGEFGIDWGNATATARWNHLFNSRLFLNSSLVYSNYNYQVGFDYGEGLVNLQSSIRSLSLKEDFHLFANSDNTFKFGGQTTYHTFVPGDIESEANSVNELRIKRKYALESAVYANHEWTATKRLSLEYGLRVSSFAVLGPGEEFEFDDNGLPLSTTTYGRGDLITHYGSIEPRATARFTLDDQSSLKASFARNRQYLHLLSTSAATTPFDIWHPSTRLVAPGTADQYAIGYFRNFLDDTYESSLELYYRGLRDQIDYKNGADIYFNEHVESELIFGEARAYGLEFLFRKNRGRLTGWLSYTLAKTEKQFDEINAGAWFPARHDRTHDIEIVGQYQLSPRWTLGVNWVYYTGNAVTFPSGKYTVDEHLIVLYSERNGYRMPAYHRLDFAFTWQRERSSWNFSLFNAYGRRNAYTIEFREAEESPHQPEAVRISLFRFFPSITYNRSF